jgi:hypothetical protein
VVDLVDDYLLLRGRTSGRTSLVHTIREEYIVYHHENRELKLDWDLQVYSCRVTVRRRHNLHMEY